MTAFPQHAGSPGTAKRQEKETKSMTDWEGRNKAVFVHRWQSTRWKIQNIQQPK